MYFFSSKANLLICTNKKTFQVFQENCHCLQNSNAMLTLDPLYSRQPGFHEIGASSQTAASLDNSYAKAAPHRRNFRGPGLDRQLTDPGGGGPRRVSQAARPARRDTLLPRLRSQCGAHAFPAAVGTPGTPRKAVADAVCKKKPLTATPQRHATSCTKSPRCPKTPSELQKPQPGKRGVPAAARGWQAGLGDPDPRPCRAILAL